MVDPSTALGDSTKFSTPSTHTCLRCTPYVPLAHSTPVATVANPRSRAYPRTGATILAANHLSHIDPIAVIAAARRTTHYLAKDGHFSNPLTSFVMRATGQIETHREAGGSDALASAASILSNECALGIFPEGTRSKRTEAPFLLPGKTGVARLAAAHPRAVVVPVALVGTRNVMQPQHHKFPRLWRRFNVNAALGDLVGMACLRARRKSNRILLVGTRKIR